METMYVIAVKHLFDYKGNTLNRWEYVQFGECGYTFFTKSVDGAHHFYSIDKAQKWFDEIGRGLIFYGNCEGQYDLESLCIKSVVINLLLVFFFVDTLSVLEVSHRNILNREEYYTAS